MKKIGLYLLGEKAYRVLEEILNTFSNEVIAFVVLAKDKNIYKDFYDESLSLCEENSINYYHKNDDPYNDSITCFAIGWRWIINSDNLIVFHDSILPKYRGFSPLVNMLISGEKTLGVTALKAVSEYDKGPIISQRSIQINYPIKIQEAISIISPLYASLAIEIIAKIAKGIDLPLQYQNEADASYSLWRNEDDYQINWNSSSDKIQRFVDSVGYPFKGASTYLNEVKVRLTDVSLYPDVEVQSREDHIGKIIFMEEGLPVVVCGRGLIKINSMIDDLKQQPVINISFRSRLQYKGN